MPERAILRDRFSQMLQTAESAAAEYQRLSLDAPADDQRIELQRLAQRELRNVELTERLLEIVEE